MDSYVDSLQYMLECYEEVDGCRFYQELFPDNENCGQYFQDFSHPNAIYLYYDPEKGKLRRRIMLKDSWIMDYASFVQENKLTLCSGLVYRKRANKLQNAQRMNALIFDLDGVGVDELKTIELRWNVEPSHLRSIPRPTYTVLSGTGVHFYYVFQEPLDLYPNIKMQLKSLKYDLIFRMWEYGSTSQVKQIQYQSINQAFRMVGSMNNKYGRKIRAFRTGEPIEISFLNMYVSKENQVDLNKPFKPTKVTLPEAKETYPDWYQRVVVEKQKKPKKWEISKKVNGDDPYALYHWWIRQSDKITGGHRYYFLMCMAIYACKCDVPKRQLVQDMNAIFDRIAGIEHVNPLTKEDMKSALEAYDKEYYDTSISEIEYWTDVRIERNKRNGRKRDVHIKTVNAMRKFRRDELGEDEYRDNGRPKGSGTAEQIVREWQEVYPDGKKAECIRDTGLSKPTVYKWWISRK